MTSKSELQHLKDREYDTGKKEILLEHLDHLVISSLAVVFIDLGLEVPRDLQKQFQGSKSGTPDIVENRLAELKKEWKRKQKDTSACIFGTDDVALEALRVRNQKWRTAYEDRLKTLPTNFKGTQCLYLGNAVRYPTLAEFSNWARN